jgi:hypothetical protein
MEDLPRRQLISCAMGIFSRAERLYCITMRYLVQYVP